MFFVSKEKIRMQSLKTREIHSLHQKNIFKIFEEFLKICLCYKDWPGVDVL
jgi:hypothetical protein